MIDVKVGRETKTFKADKVMQINPPKMEKFDDVSNMTGIARLAVEEVTIEDDSARDTSRHRDRAEVRLATCGTEPSFGERQRVEFARRGRRGCRHPRRPSEFDRDREILEFERQWWKYAGAKEQAIRDLFDMSGTRYYQLLNGLIDDPQALAFDPMLVKRLRRMRAARQRARSARRLGMEP